LGKHGKRKKKNSRRRERNRFRSKKQFDWNFDARLTGSFRHGGENTINSIPHARKTLRGRKRKAFRKG